MKKINSVLEIYFSLAKDHPEKKSFFYSEPNFSECLTNIEIWETAKVFAKLLKEKGVLPSTRVGIWMKSSWRWEIAQLAVLMCDGVVIGLDLNESKNNFEHIEKLVDLNFIIYEESFLPAKWQSYANTKVEFIYFDVVKKILKDEKSASIDEMTNFNLGKFIFLTSGTTSKPKAILYENEKMALAIQEIVRLYPELANSPRAICWLPLANLFQRVVNFSTLYCNGDLFFIENPAHIIPNISIINPTFFISVPRFYEKIFEGFLIKVKMMNSLISGMTSLGLKILNLKLRYKNSKILSSVFEILCWPTNKIIFSKVKNIFGNNIKVLISGSAPLKAELSHFFYSIGLPISEAYGTSENLIPIAALRADEFNPGSVGREVVSGSIKISDDGEVLVKGDAVFSGYLKQDDKSFFQEEYYKTGDLGYFDSKGFLFLTGRKNEMFKTNTGKKVPTKEIEEKFKQIPFVDQVITIGEGYKVPVVLLTMDFNLLSVFLGKPVHLLLNSLDGKFFEEDSIKIRTKIDSTLNSFDGSVAPGGVILLTRKLSLDGDEITPNLKLRRKHIQEKFRTHLEALYSRIEMHEVRPIQIIDSYGSEIRLESPPSGMKRNFKLISIILKVLIYKIPWPLITKTEKDRNKLIGDFLKTELGGLKGPFHKFGHILSQMPELAPVEIRQQHDEIFFKSPTINSNLIKAIVEEKLKKPISAIFSEWSDTPTATGSIGQVHKARLLDGREVAVKVLIPQIKDIIASDFKLLKLILPLIVSASGKKNLKAYFEELKTLIELEINLKNEANQYEIFKNIFSNDKDIVVPYVVHELSSEEILVTEYIHGQSFEEFESHSSQLDKNKVAEILWKTCSIPVNVYSRFNADPHPDNYIIVTKESDYGRLFQVAMIDFGFCKTWSPEFSSLWKKQVLACCDHKKEEFIELTKKLGFKAKDLYQFAANLYQANLEIIYKPWSENSDFQFSDEWMKFHNQAMLKYQILIPDLEIPKDFLALAHLYWGMYQIMARLKAKANFYKLTMPYIQSDHQLIPINTKGDNKHE